MRDAAEHEILLDMRIKKAFPGKSDDERFQIYQNVLNCVKQSQYVSWENVPSGAIIGVGDRKHGVHTVLSK